MNKIYLDTETRSEIPISRGVSAYVEGKMFAVLMVQYAINDGPVRVWEPMETGIPDDLVSAMQDKHMFVIHNSVFDRLVINKSGVLGRIIRPEDVIDTMVQAYAHGFPGGLGDLSVILGLPQDKAKDKRGKFLIQTFCVPKRGKELAFTEKHDKPEEWSEFVEYGLKDVEALREVHKKLPSHNYPSLEHDIWVYDQKINDRGIPVDVEFAEAAVKEAAEERVRLNNKTSELTRDEVSAATQRDKLLKFIADDYGIVLPALRSKDVQDIVTRPDVVLKKNDAVTNKIERILSADIPAELRELLSLRVQSSMNSAAKYKKVLDQQVGGRMRYTLQMYGATRTGRDAGRGLQPQNLRRATLWKDADDIEAAIEQDIEAVKAGAISMVTNNTMHVLSDLVRSVICATPGHKLVVADLSNIEGRGLAYLAGEEWKLQYFRDYDAGKIKFDNYKMAYAKAMNIRPEDVTKDGRQIGKVQELGLGYEGGVKAFLTFAAVYRLDIAVMADAVWASGDLARLEDCKRKYDWAKEHGYHAGLTAHEYSACEYLKQLWRDSHPKTVRFWSDLDTAFRNSIANPGEVFTVNRLKFRKTGSYLFIRLPSGRVLTYLHPAVDEDGHLSFVGVDQFTKKFQRIKTYSGKLAENVTSGFARDVLFYHIPDIEKAGYPIISRVHDEFICECPDMPEYSARKLADMMATPHKWCSDMPLAAAGFEAHRYRKD